MNDETLVEDTASFRRDGQKVSVEEAVLELLTGYSDRGTLEQVEADIDAMKRVLAKFITLKLDSLTELNELAGYGRYKVSK